MSTDTSTTMTDFLTRVPVKMTATRYQPSPDTGAQWDRAASHWRCVLWHEGRKIQVAFHMGQALTGPPTFAAVLDCLASDAAGYENASDFADWCAEYGYDADSRKAERIFRQIERQTGSLARLLGVELYEKLLWHVERD